MLNLTFDNYDVMVKVYSGFCLTGLARVSVAKTVQVTAGIYLNEQNLSMSRKLAICSIALSVLYCDECRCTAYLQHCSTSTYPPLSFYYCFSLFVLVFPCFP